MSDDAWRRARRNDDEEDFGPPLFADEPTGELQSTRRSDQSAPISFGPSDTGPLPHWSDPPTGELPSVLATGAEPERSDATDDFDVWSSFATQNPAWRGDPEDETGPQLVDPTGIGDDATTAEPYFGATEAVVDDAAPVRREPGRIQIGTDPTGDGIGRPMPRGRNRTTSRDDLPGRPRPSNRPAANRPSGGTAGRDMPMAIVVGAVMAAAFIAAVMWRPAAVVAVAAIVVGLAAVEFFDKVTEKGYRPATVIGIAACAAAPLATYYVGISAMPLIVVLALAAAAATFIGGPGIESGPMPNMAITALGVTWIGLAGAYAALIVGEAASAGVDVIGTDTIFLLALAVVANDIGALFVGSGIGKTPLRAWISPNKSIEGFVGGTVVTVIVMLLVGITGKVDTWSTGQLVALALVVSVTAPLGDLTESMFKRNLDIKDFGSLVPGHGGVLDRFDGFLFTLPAVYYLSRILEITI